MAIYTPNDNFEGDRERDLGFNLHPNRPLKGKTSSPNKVIVCGGLVFLFVLFCLFVFGFALFGDEL